MNAFSIYGNYLIMQTTIRIEMDKITTMHVYTVMEWHARNEEIRCKVLLEVNGRRCLQFTMLFDMELERVRQCHTFLCHVRLLQLK